MLGRTSRRSSTGTGSTIADQDLVLGDPGPDLMFDDRVYKRGALLLHALRLTVGDDAFFELLRGLGAEHAHSTVSTRDVHRLRRDADRRTTSGALFDEWLTQSSSAGTACRRRDPRSVVGSGR